MRALTLGMAMAWLGIMGTPCARGQITPALHQVDSTGHAPAIRVEVTPRSQASTWWQRTMRQHLLDFSDRDNKNERGSDGSSNLIVVDPVVESFVGTMQSSAEGSQPEAIWDNIRGARFQAVVDSRWHIGGELLERQGVAEPLLGLWAVGNQIPGWGRSKLGKDNGFNTAEQAYFDVSQTRGWVGWEKEKWSFDAGIDALHIGAGRSSAFLSQWAVPAPYARASYSNETHRTTVWSTRWMSTRRGPLGETAESLLERTRAVFATHQWFAGERLILQWVGSHAWETTSQTAPEGWESLGLPPGNTYRPNRTIMGLEVQYHRRINSESKLTFYAQQSWDVGVEKRKSAGPSYQAVLPFTSVIGATGVWKTWTARLEYTHQSDAHCRDCWDYKALQAGGPNPNGPMRAEIMNGGVSLNSLWKESFRLQARGVVHGPWHASGFMEMNSQANHWLIQVHHQLHSIWPLSITGAVGKVVLTEPLGIGEIQAYSVLQLGLTAGILEWK